MLQRLAPLARTAVVLLAALGVLIGTHSAAARPAISGPHPYAPGNGASNLSEPITVQWYSVAGATSYYVAYANNTDAYQNHWTYTAAAPQTSYSLYGLTSYTKYWWVPFACDASGCSDQYEWSFTTGSIPPPPGPTPEYAPPSGSIALSTSPTFQWSAPSGAIPGTTQYLLTVYDPAHAEANRTSAWTTGFSASVSGLTAGYTYNWYVTACNGYSPDTCANSQWAWVFTTAFPPPGPTPQVSPASYAIDVGTTATFTWQQPSGSRAGWVRYVVIITEPNSSTIEFESAAYTTSLADTVAGLAPNHTYWWAVYACNDIVAASCSYSSNWYVFTTMVPPPGPTQQVAPQNNATGVSSSPTFGWTAPANAAPGTTQYSVLLYEPSSEQLVLQSGYTYGLSVALSGLQDNHQYACAVFACNAAAYDSCSYSASFWYFTTAPAPPGPTQQVSPPSGATGVSTSPTFSWNAPSGSTAGATQYYVWLYDPSRAQADRVTPFTTALSAALSGLSAGYTYWWAVVACNGPSCSVSAQWSVFQTAIAAPSTPQPATPTTGASGVGATPALSWTASQSNAVDGVTEYFVALYDPDTGTYPAVLTAAQPTTSLAVPSGTLTYGKSYLWAVGACNGSACSSYSTFWYFNTANAPGTPQVVSPADQATNTGVTPTLSWSAASGAINGVTRYYWYLWDAVARAYTVQLPTTMAPSTSVQVPSSAGLLLARCYGWAGYACSGYACSAASPALSTFTTVPAPGDAQETYPGDGTSGTGTAFSATWQQASSSSYTYQAGVSDSTDYYVSICADGASSCVQTFVNQGASLADAVSGLAVNTVYWWEVVACNGEIASSCNQDSTWLAFGTGQQAGIQMSPDCTSEPPDPFHKYKYFCGTATYVDAGDGTWTITEYGWNGSLGSGGYNDYWALDHGSIRTAAGTAVYTYGSEASTNKNGGYLPPPIPGFQLMDGAIPSDGTIYWCFRFHNNAVRDPIDGHVVQPARTDYGLWTGGFLAGSSSFVDGPGDNGCSAEPH